MLEGVMKGLFLWMYGLVLECVQYFANTLLDVFKMDVTFFQQNAPVIIELSQIFIAVGWALLMGNLAFQALKSMTNGLGYEPEDPKILFCRTAVFAFLLFASPEICKVGMNLTSKVIALMQMPDSIVINTPSEGSFDLAASWLLTVIVGIIMMFQLVKFFFEIGERYVITCILTFLSPLAFAMGGSKATKDIFTGWCRMYGSMCFIMVMNVFFMKILLSAMITVPSGLMVMPWLIFIVAIAKVGRNIDSIVCRIGLNAPSTGGGRGLVPGALTMMIARTAMSSIGKASAVSASATRDSRTAHAEKSAAGNMNFQKESFGSNSRYESGGLQGSEQKTEGKTTQPQYRAENAQGAGKKDLSRSFSYGMQSSNDKYSENARLDIPYVNDSKSGQSNNKDRENTDGKETHTPSRPPLRGGFVGGLQSVKGAPMQDKPTRNYRNTSEAAHDNGGLGALLQKNKPFTVNDNGINTTANRKEGNLQNTSTEKTAQSASSASSKLDTQSAAIAKGNASMNKGFSTNDNQAFRAPPLFKNESTVPADSARVSATSQNSNTETQGTPATLHNLQRKDIAPNIQHTENRLNGSMVQKPPFAVNSVAEKANMQTENKQGLRQNKAKGVQDNAKQPKQRRS